MTCEANLGIQAAELAKDFTSKLLSNGAAEARSSVMKLAGDVSSWWAALDPGLPQPQESLETSARNPQVGCLSGYFHAAPLPQYLNLQPLPYFSDSTRADWQVGWVNVTKHSPLPWLLLRLCMN